MWQYLAASFAGNLFQGLGQRSAVKAQNRLTAAENLVNRANAEAANTVRKANNELAAAVGSLNRHRQSINNQNILQALGREQEAITTNFFRTREDLMRGSVEARLDTAFEVGALAANMAAAGVGGGSRDILNSTIRMQGARQQREIERLSEQTAYDALLAVNNLQASAYSQVHGDLFLDALDYSVNVHMDAPSAPVPSVGNILFQAGLTTVAQQPELTQQTLEGFRSTAGNSQAAHGEWYTNVSLKV